MAGTSLSTMPCAASGLESFKRYQAQCALLLVAALINGPATGHQAVFEQPRRHKGSKQAGTCQPRVTPD